MQALGPPISSSSDAQGRSGAWLEGDRTQRLCSAPPREVCSLPWWWPGLLPLCPPSGFDHICLWADCASLPLGSLFPFWL